MKSKLAYYMYFVSSFILFFSSVTEAMKRPRPTQGAAVVVKNQSVSSEDFLSVRNPIWVKCSNGQVVSLPRWKIDQIKVLLVLLEHQKDANKQTNPINAFMCSSGELKLVSDALDAASQGLFSDYLSILETEKRNFLINVSEKLEAKGLFLLCMSAILPQEIQSEIAKDISGFLLSKIKAKSYKHYAFDISNVAIPLYQVAFVSEEIVAAKGWDLLSQWDIRTKKLIKQKEVFPLPVNKTMPFWVQLQILGYKGFLTSSSGKRLRVRARGKKHTIRIEDSSSNILFSLELDGASIPFRAKVFNADENKLLIGIGHRVVLWDYITDEVITLYDGQKDITAVAFSPDETKIAFSEQGSGFGATIFVMDLLSRAIVYTIKPETAYEIMNTVSSLAFNRQGDKLAVAGDSGLYLYELGFDFVMHMQKILQRLSIPHIKLLYQLYLSKVSNAQLVLHKNSLELTTYLSLPDELKNFFDNPIFLDIFAKPLIKEDEETEITEKIDMLKILKRVMAVPQLKPCKQEHNGAIYSLAYSSVEDIVLSGGDSSCTGLENCYNNLFLWDAYYSTFIKNFCSGQCLINTVAFSPDGTQFVTGGFGSNNLMLWNRATGEKINLNGHKLPVNAVAFSHDGKKIVSGGSGSKKNLFVWDAQSGAMIYSLTGHNDSVNTVAFNSDDTMIVSGGNGQFKNLILWTVNNGKAIISLNGHKDAVNTAVFSPHGLVVVAGGVGTSHNLFMWNIDTHSRKELSGHSGSVNALVFSKDGKKLVSASDGTSNNLCVWNGAGELLYNLDGHAGPVKSLALNHRQHNLMLASGGIGGTNNLYVWDLQFGKKIYTIANNQKSINAVLFSTDDTRIVSGGGGTFGENSFAIWDLNTRITQMLDSLYGEHIELLYKLYMASRLNVRMNLKQTPELSHLFATLPQELKELACELFKVQGGACDESEAKRRRIQ